LDRVKIVIAITCLILAAVVTFLFTKGRSDNMDSLRGKIVYLKCVYCGNTSQCSAVEYYDEVEKRTTPQNAQPLLPCEKCGKDGVALAVKCEKCGNIFLPSESSNVFQDKCPKCGFSKKEANRTQK
jgi:phage FluMu protein Com